MISRSDRIAARDRADRAAKLARTYLRKVGHALSALRSGDIQVGSSFWDLLGQSIETATEIVEQLPDEFFAETPLSDFFGIGIGRDVPSTHNLSSEHLEAAKSLVALIEGRQARGKAERLVAQMEDPSGRTPEEAESFRRSAAALREKHGLGAA